MPTCSQCSKSIIKSSTTPRGKTASKSRKSSSRSTKPTKMVLRSATNRLPPRKDEFACICCREAPVPRQTRRKAARKPTVSTTTSTQTKAEVLRTAKRRQSLNPDPPTSTPKSSLRPEAAWNVVKKRWASRLGDLDDPEFHLPRRNRTPDTFSSDS
ncbi:hypothetical protein RB195_021404 [Necator americanus]|uniref:Uncharacterized protein n=1 Tax=Necator americanus TaxID=51031 RepID=A0ABR1EAU2_NECAM